MSASARSVRTPRRRLARAWAIASAVLSVVAIAATALADARTDYLVRVLRESPMFRVRTQAAISLGSVQSEPGVIDALSDAVSRDAHPAVRAAAAAALERQGDPSAIPALTRATNDREAAVRSAATRAIATLERVRRSQPRTRPVPENVSSAPSESDRFYVAVGRPGTKVRSISRDQLDSFRTFMEQQVRGMPGVVVAPANENGGAARRVLSQRQLVGYYLDTSIVEVQTRSEGGVRVRVSIVVQSYPDRNIRSMLSGTATATSGSGPTVERDAIHGALRSALRGLAPVMQVGAASAQARGPRRRR